MQKKTPAESKNLDKKNKQLDQLFNQFTETVKSKKLAIQEGAREASSALRSLRNSEKQTKNELAKLKRDTNKELGAAKSNAVAAAAKAKKDVASAFSEVDTIRDDTRKSYQRFKRTYEAAVNGERGIIARKSDIALQHDKIKKTQEDIEIINKNAHEQSSEIKEAHKEVLEDRSHVGEIKTRAEEIRTEIENTYHITVDSAMGGSLNARKKEIQKTLTFWTWALFISILVLVAAIGLLIYISHAERGSADLLEAVTNRLVYLTPLIFVIFMTYRQYSHERRLLEEYAFKATMAQSLRNYAVLLSDNYKHVDKAEEKILDFLLTSMTNIYDRTTLDNTSSFFYQFIVGNKNMGAQATIQEGKSETKQTTSKKVETKKKVG